MIDSSWRSSPIWCIECILREVGTRLLLSTLQRSPEVNIGQILKGPPYRATKYVSHVQGIAKASGYRNQLGLFWVVSGGITPGFICSCL